MTATPGDEAAIREALMEFAYRPGQPVFSRYEGAVAALDRLVAALTAARRERDEARDAIYAPVMRAEAAEAQVESLRALAKTAKATAAAPDYDEQAIAEALWAVVEAALLVGQAEGES